MIWFNILTNFIGVYPVALAIQKRRPIEGTLWLLTALMSAIYHVVDTELLDVNESIYISLRKIDYLMCDMTISSILFLLLIPHTNLRHSMQIVIIPFSLFCIELRMPIYIHFIPILFTFIISFIVYYFYLMEGCVEKYESLDWQMIYYGFFTNTIEYIFNYYLPILDRNHYDLYHGIHHLLGFMSLSFYIRAIHFRRFSRIESDGDIWKGQERVISPILEISLEDPPPAPPPTPRQKLHRRNLSYT